MAKVIQVSTGLALYTEPHFGEKLLASCTAFIATRGGAHFLVTNWHNVAGRDPITLKVQNALGSLPDRIIVWHHVAGSLGVWEARGHRLLDDEGVPLWLEHPEHGRVVDVVALPILAGEQAGLDFVSVRLDDPEIPIAVGPSSSVSIIGFPFGLTGGGYFPIWSNGAVATEPDVDLERLPLMLVDSRTRKGQSGSPVVAYRGGSVGLEDGSQAIYEAPISRFLGVYSGRVNEESDLGMVWKSIALREIIDGAHRGSDPTYAEPVEPLFEGRRTQAGGFRS